MRHRGINDATEPVALSTASAVHRRDHVHEDGRLCHPHVVEVIGLGHTTAAATPASWTPGAPSWWPTATAG